MWAAAPSPVDDGIAVVAAVLLLSADCVPPAVCPDIPSDSVVKRPDGPASAVWCCVAERQSADGEVALV